MVLISIFLFTPATATAAPRQQWSYFGDTGLRWYPDMADGTMLMADMIFDQSYPGYYTIEGGKFVGVAPSVTLITGSCYINHGADPMSAFVMVDDAHYLPLFKTIEGQQQLTFSLPVYGKAFEITVNNRFDIGCNLLLERLK
jgi:hypothetical protein